MPEIVVITNPTSGIGRGRGAGQVAARRFRDAGLSVRELTGADDDEALSLARDCVAEGVETLVAVGGDGMIHLVVQAVAGTQTRLGVIPAGTGNDFARSLGLPRRDPAAAADIVVAGRVRTIDLARVGERYVTTVLAAGFDAKVNERANAMRWPKGQLRYTLATLSELRVFEPIRYEIDVDGDRQQVDAMLVAVGNGPSYGGGLRITEGAKLDDGLLDVAVFLSMRKPALVTAYPRLFTGSHVRHPRYRHLTGRRITISAPEIVAYADGERLGPLPMTVEVAPGALHVLVP